MQRETKTSRITPKILSALPSPCWLLEEHLLEQNLQTLERIRHRTGIKILLALKGFAFWQEAGEIMRHLDGCCASGLHEAMLAAEKFGREVHAYSPAYKAEEVAMIASLSQHMLFNTPAQLKRYLPIAKAANPALSIGLRTNPEYSVAPAELYNPCGLYSRLGTTRAHFDESILPSLDGLHFHALCEESAEAFEAVLGVFEEKFGCYLPQMQWVNFGGGHHMTREGYDIEGLISTLQTFQKRHPHLRLYMEPGEAVGWQTGVLVTTVLDIMDNGMQIAILDSSAEAHMPDTLIMPYRAEVRGAAMPGVKPHTYRLAGNTCLAGDIMGDYSFDLPLQIGDKVIFEDQMHYSMVKATTFNGIPLPSIAVLKKDGTVEIFREFGYEDFRDRLG